jgi:2Fe-2S ferredoxin
MPTVVFELADKTQRRVEVAAGTSVMLAALNGDVPGIEAECGGTCSCATCHVYVDERFISMLPAPAPAESELLDFVAAERRPNSRLSCQIVMDQRIDGLVVALPEFQSP